MSKLSELSRKRLQELFEYRDGELWWRMSGPGRIDGRPAGTRFEGYRIISIGRRRYLRHRLVWFLFHGQWPSEDVDHIDGNRGNDRIENLRAASRSENMCNRGKQSDNTSGLKGVFWHKQRQKWRAQIKRDRKARHLGLFNCPAAASLAYQIAADELHGEYARHR